SALCAGPAAEEQKVPKIVSSRPPARKAKGARPSQQRTARGGTPARPAPPPKGPASYADTDARPPSSAAGAPQVLKSGAGTASATRPRGAHATQARPRAPMPRRSGPPLGGIAAI